jgi:hypothetical protein
MIFAKNGLKIDDFDRNHCFLGRAAKTAENVLKIAIETFDRAFLCRAF